VRGVLKKMLAGLLYREDITRPTGAAGRLMVRANQAVFERGATPPWVWSAERCREFWAGQGEADVNAPSSYAGKPQAIVDTLHEFWRPEVEPGMSVLETGCNAGANLAGLQRHGYERLAGVEINPRAIAQMRESFPDLRADVTQGALEEVLPRLPTGSVDVVFSMAVLLHVHPASHEVFGHMARVARRHVCLIESEAATLPYIFARNYRRVFARHGCTQVRSALLTEQAYPAVGSDYWGYTVRLFSRPAPG
jgi:SAM-dependent methyltransferase